MDSFWLRVSLRSDEGLTGQRIHFEQHSRGVRRRPWALTTWASPQGSLYVLITLQLASHQEGAKGSHNAFMTYHKVVQILSLHSIH